MPNPPNISRQINQGQLERAGKQGYTGNAHDTMEKSNILQLKKKEGKCCGLQGLEEALAQQHVPPECATGQGPNRCIPCDKWV
jgi:hypothetical protein